MRLDQWLSTRKRYVMLALAALCIVVRVIYYAQLSDGPLLWAHRWTESDNNFFDRWAKEIAAGDWLTNQELHPMVSWNYTMAKMYFDRHPEKIAEFQPAGSPPGDDAARATALWNRWLGGKAFHQEPLYAYAIALTYRLFGPDVRWVFAWQMALGVLTTLLLWDLARRYFGETAGALAGVMIALFAPLYYLELTLVRTSLQTFLAVAILYLAERAIERQSAKTWLWTGIAFGIAILGQSTLVLFAGACLLWLMWRRRIGFAAIVVGGVLLGLSPAIARNLIVGVSPFTLAANGAMTLIGGSDASATPEMGGGGWNFARVEYVMEQSDAKSWPAMKMSLASHGSAAHFAWLLARKFAKFWQWYEEPDNQNFYYFRLYSTMLRVSLTAYLVAPLILVGLLVAAPLFPRCALLYALGANGIAIALIASPVARYRAGFLAAMIPFAAYAVVRAAEEWRRGAAIAAAAVLVFLWTSRPLPAGRREIRTTDYLAPYYYYWIPEHTGATQAGLWRRAASLLQESLQVEPADVGQVKDLSQAFSQIHAQLATDLANAGDPAGAARQAMRAQDLK